ncbi:MAG: uroporphyrinogen-III C-methyltransferase [Myxococcota bacterium]
MKGRVDLVGAGPGDPDLITRKGLRCLAASTLVLYDALVATELLDEAPNARRLYVGKRAGRHAMSQRAIERLMIRFARRGERVVRLKCGDPFVFGRGGEEALALRDAGVPYDVVPGVSSCVAAPQAAGIPVTHRGVASGFLVTTGHDLEGFRHRVAGLKPGTISLVVLMGYQKRGQLADTLMETGYPADTPVALVSGATFGNQTTVYTILCELARCAVDDERAVTLVVGEVVSVGSELRQTPMAAAGGVR